MSATFLVVCFLSLTESTSEASEKNFHFKIFFLFPENESLGF